MKYRFAFDTNKNIVKSITSYSITIRKNPKYLKIDAEILSKAVDNSVIVLFLSCRFYFGSPFSLLHSFMNMKLKATKSSGESIHQLH